MSLFTHKAFSTSLRSRLRWAAFMLGASIFFNSPLYAMSSDTSAVHMLADQQTYNLAEKRYHLNGSVRVTFQDMKISGNRAEIQMDASGRPSVANFFNRPVFKRTSPNKGEDQVIGDVIKIYLNEGRYGAIGNVESKVVTVAADPFLIRSDVQEFNNRSKVVSASGNVQVDYKGSKAYSKLANLRMKPNGDAERVIFSGNARIKKENSEIKSDRITVMVESGNLIAESHVNTNVTLKPQSGKGSAAVAQPSKVFISSDYQQYDKRSDRMLASGHVKIIYGDYVAVGPKATFHLNNNDLDRIVLTGRSTITEKGRTITADRITITTNPKNFDAAGNVKVKFQAKNTSASPAAPQKKTLPAPTSAPSDTNPSLPVDHDYEY